MESSNWHGWKKKMHTHHDGLTSIRMKSTLWFSVTADWLLSLGFPPCLHLSSSMSTCKELAKADRSRHTAALLLLLSSCGCFFDPSRLLPRPSRVPLTSLGHISRSRCEWATSCKKRKTNVLSKCFTSMKTGFYWSCQQKIFDRSQVTVFLCKVVVTQW